MCLEDIRLGRSLASNGGSAPVPGGTNIPWIGPNPNRTRLIVSCNTTSNTFIWPLGLSPLGGVGFALTPTNPLLIIRIEDWGPIMTGPWFASDLGAGDFLTWMESTLEKQ